MYTKLATAVPAGAAVTFALLFIMQTLIGVQTDAVADTRPPIPTDWQHVDIDEQTIVEEFEKPDRPEELPPPVIPPTSEPIDDGPVIHVPRPPLVPVGRNAGLQNPFTNDGPVITIVRVQPAYPPVAEQRGVEGYVIVEFDVLPDGTVGQVAVVESSNPVFERSAIHAAKRFRFKARVVDGVPLATSGIQYRFRFSMDN